MFRKPSYEKVIRSFFLFKTTEDITLEDQKLLDQAERTLNLFGSSLDNNLKVEKFQRRGGNMKKVDEYTAMRPK